MKKYFSRPVELNETENRKIPHALGGEDRVFLYRPGVLEYAAHSNYSRALTHLRHEHQFGVTEDSVDVENCPAGLRMADVTSGNTACQTFSRKPENPITSTQFVVDPHQISHPFSLNIFPVLSRITDKCAKHVRV